MNGSDVLTNALNYALAQTNGPTPPVAVLNATGFEDKSYVKHSNHICNKFLNTLDGVFNTILIRATRQNEETLGLVAQAMAHIAPEGTIFIAQENAHGADSLEKRLKKGFSSLETHIKHKCRTMALHPKAANTAVLAEWQAASAMQKAPKTGLWSVPGLFSWDRLDTASTLLLGFLPEKLAGAGADLGCGYGYLSVNIIKKDGVSALYALDSDARAIETCGKNLAETGTAVPYQVLWADATAPQADLPKLDWVVMNPPFHTQQHEDKELGQKFCTSALKMLKSGGSLYLVANRHLPYEAILEKAAKRFEVLAESNGFKIIKAVSK